MRIPMPPKMPKLLRHGRTDTLVCSLFRLSKLFTARYTRFSPAQNKNHRGHQGLHPDQPQRVCQVLRKKKNQSARSSQVAQCDILKHSASDPRRYQFAPREYAKILRLPFDGRDALTTLKRIATPSDRIFALFVFVSFSVAHILNPALARATCNSSSLSSDLCVLCALRALCVNVFSFPQVKTGQSFLRAMRAKSFDGFTAAGFPTASSIQRSLALSPYAKHLCKFKSSSVATRRTARAFASPNIASPKIRPVHRLHFTSNRVAQTQIFVANPRSPSSASNARTAPSANGSSVPLTITIKCPRSACHSIRSIASG